MLDDLGLAAKRDAAFGTLSGGQRQRLSIALALVGDPEIVIFDELTTGLDPQARRETWQLIEAVRDRGVTVVLVTHFMEEAERLCDRVAVIDAGRIAALDRAGAIVADAVPVQRVWFRPETSMDDALMTALPEVGDVVHSGPQVGVTGTGKLLSAVIFALAEHGIVVDELRVEQASLDDAFLASLAPRWRTDVNGLRSLTLMEARLFWRDKAQVFFVFVLPLMIVLGFGSVPAIREGSEDFAGEPTLDALIAPIGIALLLAVMAYTIVPQHVVAYREKGVLRRLSASPVRPETLLSAVLAVKVAAVVIGAVLVLGVGGLALGLSVPQHPIGFAVVFVLGTPALLSLGLLIAAQARTVGAATAIGMLLFFPSMFLGGIYVPSEQLPGPLQRIGEIAPLGALLQALRDSWVGGGPQPLHLGVLTMATVVFGVLAARTFRWE